MRSITLILHNIRSRFNVGAIFRTADAAGVEEIYLTGITPAPPHPKIDKVALGATKYIPWEKNWRIDLVIKKLKKDGYQIIALEQSKKSIPYYKFKAKNKTALILGAEIKGLSKNILKKCDAILEIPMQGKKESLNVAVACGIVLFASLQYNNMEMY